MGNFNPKFSVGTNCRDQQAQFPLRVFPKLLARLLGISFCLLNPVLMGEIFIHSFLMSLDDQRSVSSPSVHVSSLSSPWYLLWSHQAGVGIPSCSSLQSYRQKAVIFSEQHPLNTGEWFWNPLSAFINVRLPLRDFFSYWRNYMSSDMLL